MKTIPIVYSADNNFAMPLAVSIYSLVRNLLPNCHARIHVVDGGITERNKQKILQVAERANAQRFADTSAADTRAEASVEWVEPDMQGWFGQTLRGKGDLNEMTFYRLAMTEFLPADADGALYVDSDFFFKGDASEVFDLIPDDAALAAVPDYSFPTHGRRYAGNDHAQNDLGFEQSDEYFNAGFLGVNLCYWRSHPIADTVVKFLEDHNQYAWLCDQDAMNYALRGEWHALDQSWNFHPSCRDTLSRYGWSVEERFGVCFEQIQAEAKAVHFTGKKPWDQGFTNPERSFFIAELRRSGWFSKIGYIAWSLRWYMNLFYRGFEKTWLYRVRPKLFSDASKRHGGEKASAT